MGAGTFHLPCEQGRACCHQPKRKERATQLSSPPGLLEHRRAVAGRKVKSTMELLSIRLTIAYPNKEPILHDLRLNVATGEVLGLVGHSGCGKSSLALAILGLLKLKAGTATGSILWKGRELLTLNEKEWRKLRGREIAYVPQSPMSSLNPALRIRTQLAEAWKLHGGGSGDECRGNIFRALSDVSLPASEDFVRRFPSEIS